MLALCRHRILYSLSLSARDNTHIERDASIRSRIRRLQPLKREAPAAESAAGAPDLALGIRARSTGSAQLLLSQVLLKAPELLMELVESSWLPLLSTMMIEVGLCDENEVPFASEAV